MTGKKKYIPISKLPRLLQRDMTIVVNKKPTELELIKEEFHRKRLREKEAKIIEMYELKQRKVIERVVPRERPLINNKTSGVNTKKPSITKQEPVRNTLPEGERKKSMAEIQAHFRRPFKINAPRRSTVPNIEKPLIKRSAGRDKSNLLPPIEHTNTNQYQQKNVQSKNRPMSASGGSSSPKEVSESQSTMTGMKNLKPGFTNDEKRKPLSKTDSNGNNAERQIIGVSVDEVEGLQDFYKWKIELMRANAEQLYNKALKAKRMSGESTDGLKEGFEERLLSKQREVLNELAERQREHHRMEEQRLEKARQEAEESEKRAAMERKRQEKIKREQEAKARREERKIAQENLAREERERRAKAQQEAEEHEEEPPLEHVVSHSPPPEGIYQKTKRMRNSNSESDGDFNSKANFQQGTILIKQNELLAELAERERELKIIPERRLELERQEAEESEERTPRTPPVKGTQRSEASPDERSWRSTPKKRSSVAMTPPTTNNFEQAELIDYPDVEFYTQAAEDASQTDSQPFNLKECRICGRRFAAERLQKHESCCKTANKKRKKFDPAKKRWQGTDALLYHGKADKKAAPPKRKIDYRKQHEEFKKTVEYAKKVQEIEKNGGDIRQITPPPPTVNPDYVQCPHCERRFNAAAAERHIPRCVDLKGRPLRKR